MPIYALALRRAWPRLPQRLVLAFAPTALTHPFVWFAFPALFPDDRYWTMVLAAETFAVVGEAIFLRLIRVDWRSALGWSLIANGSSVGIGLTCRALFGWP